MIDCLIKLKIWVSNSSTLGSLIHMCLHLINQCPSIDAKRLSLFNAVILLATSRHLLIMNAAESCRFINSTSSLDESFWRIAPPSFYSACFKRPLSLISWSVDILSIDLSLVLFISIYVVLLSLLRISFNFDLEEMSWGNSFSDALISSIILLF